MLTGDNGILTQATKAKDETIKAGEIEAINLAMANVKMKKSLEGYEEIITASELQEQLHKDGKETATVEGEKILTVTFSDTHNTYRVTQEGEINYEGENTLPEEDDGPREVDRVKIPKGFYYVGGTKEEGIVISDDKVDKEKYKDEVYLPGNDLIGNQFVWVPVEEDTAFKEYEGYSDAQIQTYLQTCSEPYSNGYTKEIEEYNKMKQSVLSNNGFFVARYEIGKENEQPVIKKDAEVWTNIMWGNSMQDDKGGAVEKAKSMYTNKSKYDVTSTLIYSIQWDAIMTWIDPAYKNGTCHTGKSFCANSTDRGNFSHNMMRTGSNDYYRVKNIYDLAGNAWEWVMQGYNEKSRIIRGGGNNFTGLERPASCRDYHTVNSSGNSLGFRTALYL